MNTVKLQSENPIEYSDGFLRMQTVWVVIRRNPNRFKLFLNEAEARAQEGELWSRHMYEDRSGGVDNWSNLVRADRGGPR